MKNKLFVQYLMPLAYSLFFTGAMSALIWITATYGSLNAVPIAAGLCAALYCCLAMVSLVNLFKGNKLFSGSSADVLSVPAQKAIRTAGVLIAAPALLYCAIFAFEVKSYSLTGDVEALERFGSFEKLVFGKSMVCEVAGHEHYCSAPLPVAPVSAEPEEKPTLSAQKDVDFGPYMANLQRRIKRAWFPPRSAECKRVTVKFKVHSDGAVTDLLLVNSSGIAQVDKAALKAVANAAPMRPLPEGAPSDVDIQFTFDYNVFGRGENSNFRDFGHDSFSSSSGDSFSSSPYVGDTFDSVHRAEEVAEQVKPVE
jgi:TonB family protein